LEAKQVARVKPTLEDGRVTLTKCNRPKGRLT
jgi:hypothetical protein